jgi:hypothetical protein
MSLAHIDPIHDPNHDPIHGWSQPAPLIRRSDLVDGGADPDDIKRRLARGEWTRVRRGIYVPTDDLRHLTPRERHLLAIDAALLQANERSVLSHRSAAYRHGIDLRQPPPGAVEVTNPDGHAGHRRAGLHTYCAVLEPDEIVMMGRHRVTSVARTLVDLGRCRPFEEAVVATDHALVRALVTRAELTTAVARASRRPGVCAADRAVRFADGRAGSVGESASRVLIDQQSLPKPELQLPIYGRGGQVFAHCDFGWPEHRTVGEFDGAHKYGRLLRPGEPPGDRIFAEKVREDKIRELGWHVVRWTWSDLSDPRALADRIRRAIDVGAAQHQARR